jgi:hypothetical protein
VEEALVGFVGDAFDEFAEGLTKDSSNPGPLR